MRLTNVPFQGVVVLKAGAGHAVGRNGIRNLGVGLPRTRMILLVVSTITSVTHTGDARARALLEACVNITCAFRISDPYHEVVCTIGYSND